MNKTFGLGFEAITSYRNSKNYGTNWISAGYSLWFLREAKYLNNARLELNTSCAISGTGFLLSRKLVEENGGWKHHLLTEDVEFSVDSVIQGKKIGYCSTAMLYDEAAHHLPPVVAAADALGEGLLSGTRQIRAEAGQGDVSQAVVRLL